MAVQFQQRLAIEQHSTQAGQFAERYRAIEAPYQSCFAYSRHRLQRHLDSILASGAGRRLLDVGCGTGHHLAEMRQRGFDVTGVDGSEEMLAHARTLNSGAELRLAEVESLPFPDASFDVIICIEVLRYLPCSQHCTREMARVLRPGGLCLTTATPLCNLNGYWLVNRLAEALQPPGLVHLRQFFTTAGTLRREFRQAGFNSVSVHGVYLGPINWVERLAPALLPRLLRAWERLDEVLADHLLFRDLSNMYLVHATRHP